MSYQTPHYFDPTALLMIKNEVDQSISAVESTVNILVEDKKLPFAIDDALHQLEQCGKVLSLIDLPNLGQIAQYCAELMRKIMLNPQQLNIQEVEALSEGTTMLKRYLDFASLREVNVPVLLLDTLNRLELVLGKPVTHDGAQLLSQLNGQTISVELPAVAQTDRSDYIHQLYKLSLLALLQHKKTNLDIQAMKMVGMYLVNQAKGYQSEYYWGFVNVALDHLDKAHLTDARLRTLVAIEQQIGQFLASPQTFSVAVEYVIDVLNLCISQDSALSQSIRQQLNVQDGFLTDGQIRLLAQQLHAPDDQTIHEVCQLARDEINNIRREIEYNYQNLSTEQIEQLQQKLFAVARVMKVLNLEDAYILLNQQAEKIVAGSDVVQSPKFAQEMMDSVLSVTNALGHLERQYISSRLQLGVYNNEITLDLVDSANQTLLKESKEDIILLNQQLISYLSEPNEDLLTEIIEKVRELAGAALFLGQPKGYTALMNTVQFLRTMLEQQINLEKDHVDLILEVLAGIDFFIDHLQNGQPVLVSTFDRILQSSQTLSS